MILNSKKNYDNNHKTASIEHKILLKIIKWTRFSERGLHKKKQKTKMMGKSDISFQDTKKVEFQSDSIL